MATPKDRVRTKRQPLTNVWYLVFGVWCVVAHGASGLHQERRSHFEARSFQSTSKILSCIMFFNVGSCSFKYTMDLSSISIAVISGYRFNRCAVKAPLPGPTSTTALPPSLLQMASRHRLLAHPYKMRAKARRFFSSARGGVSTRNSRAFQGIDDSASHVLVHEKVLPKGPGNRRYDQVVASVGMHDAGR